jgi:ribose transport system permease protein
VDSLTSGILLVTREQDEDKRFAEAIETGLRARGQSIVRWIQGDPRAARQGLEDLAQTGQRLGIIVTTPECGAWTILKDVGSRFPALGTPSLVIPESVRWPTFLTRQNLLNVANQISVVAILAIGMTLVIITGGIDLSVGSVVALSAVIVSVLIRDQAGGLQASALASTLCSVVGILVGALVGMLTGVVVAVFKVPPFIATLAGMQVTSGLAFIVARGGSIYEVPERFTWIGRGADILGIPNGVLLMLGLYLAAHAFMTRSVVGRRIYAAGGNPVAARYSGVSVPRVLLLVYTLCGALAGLGGVILVSQLKSGAPTYGSMIELDVIAAVVVGGTSLSGGQGRMFGTLIGALIIAVIRNGMNLTDVQAYNQKVVLGLVILGAVLVDLLKKRDWKLLGRGLWKQA